MIQIFFFVSIFFAAFEIVVLLIRPTPDCSVNRSQTWTQQRNKKWCAECSWSTQEFSDLSGLGCEDLLHRLTLTHTITLPPCPPPLFSFFFLELLILPLPLLKFVCLMLSVLLVDAVVLSFPFVVGVSHPQPPTLLTLVLCLVLVLYLICFFHLPYLSLPFIQPNNHT